MSDYILPDPRWAKASSEFDNTEDVMVVPENEWRCRTCLWKAGPPYSLSLDLTRHNISPTLRKLRIGGCPRCNVVVQCVTTLGIKRDNNIIEFIKGHYRDPDWFRIQEDLHPPFQILRSAYDGRARREATSLPKIPFYIEGATRNALVLPMNSLGKSTSAR